MDSITSSGWAHIKGSHEMRSVSSTTRGDTVQLICAFVICIWHKQVYLWHDSHYYSSSLIWRTVSHQADGLMLLAHTSLSFLGLTTRRHTIQHIKLLLQQDVYIHFSALILMHSVWFCGKHVNIVTFPILLFLVLDVTAKTRNLLKLGWRFGIGKHRASSLIQDFVLLWQKFDMGIQTC